MQTDHLDMITRRRLVAGAAIGSAAVPLAAYGTAFAQSSAAPGRVRGPTVWLDMD